MSGTTPQEDTNDHLVLISGESATGKSASLMGMKDPEGVLYLNCESGKRLPFKSKFEEAKITDSLQVYEAFEYANTSEDIHTVVIDTLTFLMEMYESVHVLPSTNTMAAWGQYAQFFKNLMQQYVARSEKRVVFLAHTLRTYSEKDLEYIASVPVKGSLKNQGLEAYFSTVVSTKKKVLKDLKNFENDMLNITTQDERVGFKYVFQTQLTKETSQERIRTPLGMFTYEQTYIDNNTQALMDHIVAYYS